jgi:hypothetical protein
LSEGEQVFDKAKLNVLHTFVGLYAPEVPTDKTEQTTEEEVLPTAKNIHQKMNALRKEMA